MVVMAFPFIIQFLLKTRKIKRLGNAVPEERRYQVAQRYIRIMMRIGRIRTEYTGQEQLPREGGYVMYSNHQGKFDSLGIMYAHPKPCTLVMDYERSHLPIVDPFIDLVQGKRLDKRDMRGQLKIIMQIAEEVKAGRKYIVFPEGGYDHNKNDVQDFMSGAFKCATKAEAPIVPVALVDSYKPFGLNSIKRVKTQVHFLKPIPYEEYKGMTTPQIAELVKDRIGDEINKRLRAARPRT